MSRPLHVKSIPLHGFLKRPKLARGMLICLGLAAVAISVYGPGVLAAFVPHERFLEESRGPTAHALADALYTPEERSLAGHLGRLRMLQMLVQNPTQESLGKLRGNIRGLEQTVHRFEQSRRISGYRGQMSFYAGQCLARLGEIYNQLAPLEARVGWHDAAKKSTEKITESWSKARENLHHATEEYQFRHIYYELAKVDYYLAVKSHGQDREKARDLLDEAEICFRTAARIYPRNLEYHHDLAKFLLSARRDFNGALEAWKGAYRLQPKFLDTRLLPEARAQAAGKNIELAEWLYRAAFELAKEFLGPKEEIAYASELCRFYSDHGMPDQLEQVVRDVNSRHKERTDAFGLAAHYLTLWNRGEQAEQMIFDQLERQTLDISLITKCRQLDGAYHHYNKPELQIPFWERVARYPADPQVAPHVYLQLGYRFLSAGRNPAESFAAISTAARMAADSPPEGQTKLGGAFQDISLPFLLPIMLR